MLSDARTAARSPQLHGDELRLPRVLAADAEPNPRQRRLVVAAHERHETARVPLHDLQHVVCIDAAVGS
jgi:hypothetical protein